MACAVDINGGSWPNRPGSSQEKPRGAPNHEGVVLLPLTTDLLTTRAVPDGPPGGCDRRHGFGDRYRWESEMTSVVAARMARLVARSGDHIVVGEVPAGQGIADLAAVRFDPDAIRHRLAFGIGPMPSPLRVQTMYQLREDRGLRVETLARRLGTSARALTRSTLSTLSDLGIVELAGGMARSTGAWRPVATHITAVELKLSKWRDALRQADNFALSADRSWVVLDAVHARAAVEQSDLFSAFGVGLAAVGADGNLRVILAPRGRRPERWLRALMAEHAWATAEREVADDAGP